MRRRLLLVGLLALAAGCRSAPIATPLPADDPRPAALLAAWRAHTDAREALRARARLAVDAPGVGPEGKAIALRSRQRVWLARPARLRVEVLGFLETALAVLVTDGERYAFLETTSRRFEDGPVYDGLLWDAARLDLAPAEAVAVILGLPGAAGDWQRAEAWQVDEETHVELVSEAGNARRTLAFGPAGELRSIDHRDDDGRTTWRADFDDFTDLDGAPFARSVALESESGRAELTLRDVELNPTISEDWFRLSAPPGAPEGG